MSCLTIFKNVRAKDNSSGITHWEYCKSLGWWLKERQENRHLCGVAAALPGGHLGSFMCKMHATAVPGLGILTYRAPTSAPLSRQWPVPCRRLHSSPARGSSNQTAQDFSARAGSSSEGNFKPPNNFRVTSTPVGRAEADLSRCAFVGVAPQQSAS